MAVGVMLLNRLARTFGGADPSAPAFPRPEQLAGRAVEEFRALGFSTNKARALLTLADTFGDDPAGFDDLPQLSNEEACRRLLGLRGIGIWSAEYVLLRGLGRLDVFPSGDMGAGNRIAKWLGVPGPLDNVSVKVQLPELADYAGLLYFHMLLLGAGDRFASSS